jgi:NAD-dependent DNA ligase
MGKGKNVVFTGVRSQALERLIESLGGVVKSSVSINTDVVVFADRRGKYEKAVELSDTRVQRGKAAIALVPWPDVQVRAEKAGFALK